MKFYRIRALYAIVLLAFALAGVSNAAQAQTGQIRVVITKAAFIVGASGGSGTLIFHGHHYPLRVGGLSIGIAVGASTTELVGTVSNIFHPSDVAGIYSSIGAGGALVAGGGGVTLQNSKGVVLTLTGRSIGLDVSINLSGLNVSLR